MTVSLDSDFYISEIKEPVLNKKQTAKGRFDKLPSSFISNTDLIKQNVEKLPHFWFMIQDKVDIRV
jgi:hypothetical protein